MTRTQPPPRNRTVATIFALFVPLCMILAMSLAADPNHILGLSVLTVAGSGIFAMFLPHRLEMRRIDRSTQEQRAHHSAVEERISTTMTALTDIAGSYFAHQERMAEARAKRQPRPFPPLIFTPRNHDCEDELVADLVDDALLKFPKPSA